MGISLKSRKRLLIHFREEIRLADSNITKRALSQALKELIKTRPIEKISVGNICDACGLNRKSFYYHFQDKYDLINWIYCTEFLDTALSADCRAKRTPVPYSADSLRHN